MENSTIYKKLLNIQGLSIQKDEENPYYHTKYASLSAIVATLTPILKQSNILVTHKTDKKQLITAVIDVESGESINSIIDIPELTDPQKIGSFITYAKRYNLSELFNLITDEDDDANSVSLPTKNTETKAKVAAEAAQASKVVASWQEPVVISKEQEKTISTICPKCGKTLWESKFPDKTTGLKYYYCAGYKNPTMPCYYKVLVQDDEITLDDYLDNALKNKPPFKS